MELSMAARPGTWTLRVPFRPQIGLLADKVRRQISRFDDAEVRKARRLARLSRADALDVLYLGDSESSFVALYDVDGRQLFRMISDLLGETVRMHTVHGGSYNVPLYSGFLRLVQASESRPLVILPLSIRFRTVPWIEHPVHGRKRAVQFLSELDPNAPLWRIRKGFPPPTPAEWDAFHRLPHPTWAGDWTIGDYVERLKNAAVRDDDWVKLLYAYHHGGRVPQGSTLDEVTRLGAELRQLGVPVVAYLTPVPFQKGEEFYPGFSELAQMNFADLEEAFVAGYGPGATVLQTGMVSGTDEFIDWRDGSEHLNEHGRRRLAASIAEAVGSVARNRS
jgi:hypothetical protein